MRRLIILVAGGTGSGKTTLAERLRDSLPSDACEVVSLDNYYREFSEPPKEHNFDEPQAYDLDRLAQDVKALKKGKTIQKIEWSFMERKRRVYDEPFPESDATQVVVEGLFALYDEDIRKLADLKIFVDLNPNEGIARRLKRDLEKNDRPVDSFERTERIKRDVVPGYEKYVLPTREFANIEICLDSSERFSKIFRLIVNSIRGRIR